MTAAAVLNVGQTTVFGHKIYFLAVYCTYVVLF